ncbi:hypothetical protein HFN89_01275 [Rhizobium laguerreae]|nr:hypothetical protein [Rhizobium laguerreae]
MGRLNRFSTWFGLNSHRSANRDDDGISKFGRIAGMLPANLFYDLVDARIAFRVLRKPSSGYQWKDPWKEIEFRVSRAKDGLISLTIEGDKRKLIGSATEILSRLNALIVAADTNGVPLDIDMEEGPTPILDDGKPIDFSIKPEKAMGTSKGFPEIINVRSDIIVGSLPTEKDQISIVQSWINKKFVGMYVMLLDDFATDYTEMTRLSPNALPREFHAMLASKGFERESFISLYGQSELDKARSEADQKQSDWINALTGSRRAPRG